MTKWHHLDCFPFDAKLVASPEEIKGFSTLKSSDQEDLKKLLAGQHEAQKNRKRTEGIESEVGESDPKKKIRVFPSSEHPIVRFHSPSPQIS